MIEEIGREERRGRKAHQCYHCYTPIPKSELRDVFTGKIDGRVYTLHAHLDCTQMSGEIVSMGYAPDYWDGVPPLRDELVDSNDFERECGRWRGHYPHVVCRMELIEQKCALRLGEQVFG